MNTDRPDRGSLRANRLLALLDDSTLSALAPHFELVPLALRDMVMREAQPVAHVYFPVQGVISMLAAQRGSGTIVEIGTVGNEGMAGLPLFLGAARAPGDAFAQVSGSAWRMAAAPFEHAAETSVALARVLHRYTQALLVQVSQSTACNRVHGPTQRLARWLLMTGDRTGDEFEMTQEFMGQMLGERRPTVSRAASDLQDQRLIQYSRGHITIQDRRGLEQASCPCYRVIRDEYDSMLAPR